MYKVEDFVDIEENLSGYDVNDLVHICKRQNNPKRDYLFVNRYQGKHVPEKPYNIFRLFDKFFTVVKRRLDPSERIVVVGFAETATALSQHITAKLHMNKKFRNSIVYHLQTTREEYDCVKLIDFSEEHSHATNQYLYCKDMSVLKEGSFDRILFVEDEITTGKTILNFIEKFKKLYPNCKYSVASILNWQNDENKAIFEDNGIDRIYLVSGKIKDSLPTIEVNPVKVLDYFNNVPEVKCRKRIINLNYDKKFKQENGRLGLDPHTLVCLADEITESTETSEGINNFEKVMVIGTEEFMYAPLFFSREIQPDYGCASWFRATTRSPIVPSADDGYILTDAITLPSAYDENRQTYLYNMQGDYNKIFVLTDGNMNDKFINALCAFSKDYNKDIIFVKV